MVYFRSRISQDLINKINKRMVKKKLENPDKEGEEKREIKNKGQLILDALLCAFRY
jgi:transposase, IS5 family